MSVYGDRAYGYFKQGYNCSQSVAAAFCDRLNLSEEFVLTALCGFGGGVGRMREVCGALSGAVFVISCLYADQEPGAKNRVYPLIQEFSNLYASSNGGNSFICHELLGLSKGASSPTAEKRTEEYYRKRPCAELVRLSADLLSEFLDSHPHS